MVMFLVIFCMSFHAFPEKWPILSALIVPVDSWGGLGGPLSGPEGHQIVSISLVLNAYWHIGMFVFFVIFVPFTENSPILSAFILHPDVAGGSGRPPGAPRWAFRRPEAASNC